MQIYKFICILLKFVPVPSHFFEKSLLCRFLVILGSFTTNPSSSFDILTWQPNLDLIISVSLHSGRGRIRITGKTYVSVKPNAKSNISFSSSSGSGILSYMLWSAMMTWQVEHAAEPPQAPSTSRSYSWAISSRLSPGLTRKVLGFSSLSMKVILSLSVV